MPRSAGAEQPSQSDERRDSAPEAGPEHFPQSWPGGQLPGGAQQFFTNALFNSHSPNPIHDKLEPEHITKALDLAGQAQSNQAQINQNQYEFAKSELEHDKRRLTMGVIVLVILLLFVLSLVLLLKESPELLVPLLSAVGGLMMGVLGGWGLARHQG